MTLGSARRLLSADRFTLPEPTAQRLADLHAAFADETTSAVMCLRGGYGSNYLLDDMDLDLIRKHPKPFFAYSDLTGVQLRLLDDWVCLRFMARWWLRISILKTACTCRVSTRRLQASLTALARPKGCAC